MSPSQVAHVVRCWRAPLGGVLFLIVIFWNCSVSGAVFGESSNQGLVPDENIVISGPEHDPVVTITPVTDGGGTASIRFSALTPSGVVPLQLNATPANRAPYVEAGDDRMVMADALLTLRGDAADDGLPENRLRTIWKTAGGPAAAIFADPAALVTTARFPVAGWYLLSLEASDGELGAVDEMLVFVTTAENFGPEITDVTLVSVTDSNAIVTWKTAVPATSEVEYGTTAAFGLTATGDEALTESHRIELRNLRPKRTYSFRALSRDEDGNLTMSADFSFTTRAKPARVYIPMLVEAAELEEPMVVEADPVNPNQRMIWSELEFQGAARWTFYIPEEGVYRLWFRVRAPSFEQNALFFSLDEASEDVYDVAQRSPGEGWQWDQLSLRDGGVDPEQNPRDLRLTAGLHTLALRGLEPYTAVSRILITNDREFVPVDDQPVGGFGTAADLTNAVIRITVDPGYSMIANQLHRQGNTVSEVLPEVPEGTRLYKYNRLFGQYRENTFAAGAWSNPDQSLAPGEGAFIFNPTEAPIELGFAGELKLQHPIRILPAGSCLLSAMYPRSGPVNAVLDFPVRPGDSAFKFNPATGGYEYYELGSEDVPFTIEVGESFFFFRN